MSSKLSDHLVISTDENTENVTIKISKHAREIKGLLSVL